MSLCLRLCVCVSVRMRARVLGKGGGRREGDLGVVALQSRRQQQTMAPVRPLSVADVFRTMKAVSAIQARAVHPPMPFPVDICRLDSDRQSRRFGP